VLVSVIYYTKWHLQYLFGFYNTTRQDIYTLEQVEVLKGPASVLYGAGSPGGIINVVTKRPHGVTKGELRLDYGSFDRKQIATDINIAVPGAEDQAQFRFVGILSEHHDRAASRAQKVEKVSKRHLAAIEAGIANTRLQRQEQEYRDRLDEAQAHLAGLAILLADEVAQVQRSREAAKRHRNYAVRLRAEFQEVVDRAKREAVVADAPQQQPSIKSPGPQTGAQRQIRASADLDCRQSEARPVSRWLSEKEKEDFIQFVLDHKVRLVIRNRVYVPKVTARRAPIDRPMRSSNSP
jgi:outer membrane receptor for ferric coprogen and ferric-rhodotorulic acid